MTQPGVARQFTFPQNKIEEFVAEAYQYVNMITLSTFPSPELRDRGQHDPTFPDAPPAAFYISAPRESYNNEPRRVSAAEQPLQRSTTNDRDDNRYPPQGSQQLGANEGDIDNGRFTSPQYQQRPSHRSQTLPSSQQLEAYEGAVDDFGVNIRSSPPYQQQFRSIGSHHPQHSSQGTVNPPFSQALPPSQQLQVSEDDFGGNVRSTAPPYQQRSPQGTTNPSFSQTLPSSRQLGANEGVDDFGVNTHSTGPPYQRFSQGSSNVSFSPTIPPSQQIRVNEGTSDNFGHNAVRPPAAPPYEQHFSQTLPRSQQAQVNEGAVDDVGVNEGDIDNVRSTGPQYQQQPSQRSQTLPSSQQLGANEGAVDDFGVNTHSTDPPNQQRFSQGSSNSSFSPSQQNRVESTSDNFGHNVRPAASPYEQQQLSQGSVNSSLPQTSPPHQQPRVNERADDIDPNVHSPHPQRSSTQGIANSSFSQTLPPTQQSRVNEGAVGPNAPSTGSPHPQQFSHGTVDPFSSSQRLPPSQQIRANEAGVDNSGSNVLPTTLPQQRSVSPLFSRRSPPSQHPRVNESNLVDNVRSTGSPHSQQFSQGTVSPLFSRPLSPHQQIREGALDNVGSIVRSGGPGDSSSTAGSRIASFQVQTRPAGSTSGYSLQDLPPISDSSFSTSVANALHENFDDLPGTKISPWVNNQLYDNSEGMTRRPYNQPANAGSSSSHSPLPATARSRNRQSPSGLVNQWTNLEGGPSNRSSLSSQSSEYHGSLIEPVREESKNREIPPRTAVLISVPPATATTTTALSAQDTNEENNRHVRFGDVEDVDREIERRGSLEDEQRANGMYPIFH